MSRGHPAGIVVPGGRVESEHRRGVALAQLTYRRHIDDSSDQVPKRSRVADPAVELRAPRSGGDVPAAGFELGPSWVVCAHDDWPTLHAAHPDIPRRTRAR